MLTTSDDKQQALIKILSANLELAGIPITNVGLQRHARHLRFLYKDGDYKKMFQDIVPCTIQDADISLSTQYKTEILTTNADLGNLPKGSQIYIVNRVSPKGELTYKELVPTKFITGGKKYSKTQLKNSVITSLESMKLSVPIKKFLGSLLYASETASGYIDSDYIGQISDSDIKIICKDFGEISGALWYLSVYDSQANLVEYPLLSNMKLVDYYIHKTKTAPLAISSKSGKGSPASIDSIAKKIVEVDYSSDVQKQKIKKLIVDIGNSNGLDAIVLGNRVMETPGYKYIEATIGSTVTPSTLEDFMKKIDSPDMVFQVLDPFFKITNYMPKREKVEAIYSEKSKRNGIILAALAYHLCKTLNANPIAAAVLNEVARSLQATQLYMSINKSRSTVEYRIDPFQNLNFIFFYNGNPKEPTLKKISFKMARPGESFYNPEL